MKNLVFIDNGKVVTDSLTVADVFGKDHDKVIRDIRNQIEKLNEAGEQEFSLANFGESTYTNDRGREYRKINLTEEAFTIIAMSYVTPEAMKMKVKFIQEFKRLKDSQSGIDTSKLSPELQMFNTMFAALAKNELEQKRISAEVAETKQEVQNIREIVALNTRDWRKDVNTIINDIARKLGGHEQYRNIRNESYELLEQRASANLRIRVINKQKKMALEGVAKSKIDKVSKLDVIDEDKRLLEIYLAVIKELAIKYQVEIKEHQEQYISK